MFSDRCDDTAVIDELATKVATATEVLVVRGTDYDEGSRARTKTLHIEPDPVSIAQLVEALHTVSPLNDDAALMQWPTYSCVFRRDRHALALVGWLDGWLRWDGWGGDRTPVNAHAVRGWLQDRAGLGDM